MRKKIIGTAVLALAVICLLTGCRGEHKSSRLVFTMGLSKDELFQVEGDALTVPEAKILLMTELARYRNLYGEGMLTQSFGDKTLEESIKETTLQLLGKIMIMDQMAGKYQIMLSREEESRAEEAAAEYYSTLSDAELSYTGADEEDAKRLLKRIALADKVYEELTGEEDIEISDDEARVVTIRHIMIKTAEIGEDGVEKPYGDMQKQDAYTRILEIFDQLQQGADFDSMAEKYNEDSRTEYTVGRGELDETLEEEAFSMDTGEMSTVLESAKGFHILFCVNNFDREATEQNKTRIMAQRKWQTFEETYNAFAAEQVCEFREKRWKELSLGGEEITNTGFYEIYEKFLAPEGKP